MTGERIKIADCLATAAVLAAHDNLESAAVLWGAGRAVADTIVPYRVPLTKITDCADVVSVEDSVFYTEPMLAVCDRLGPERARAADERGAGLAFDAVLELVRDVLARKPQGLSGSDRSGSSLSLRERDLLALVAEGLTDSEIAEKLFISIHTVRSHLDRIKDKTGARRRAELTRLALHQGITSPKSRLG